MDISEYIEVSDDELIEQCLNSDEFQTNEYIRKLYNKALLNKQAKQYNLINKI